MDDEPCFYGYRYSMDLIMDGRAIRWQLESPEQRSLEYLEAARREWMQEWWRRNGRQN